MRAGLVALALLVPGCVGDGTVPPGDVGEAICARIDACSLRPGLPGSIGGCVPLVLLEACGTDGCVAAVPIGPALGACLEAIDRLGCGSLRVPDECIGPLSAR